MSAFLPYPLTKEYADILKGDLTNKMENKNLEKHKSFLEHASRDELNHERYKLKVFGGGENSSIDYKKVFDIFMKRILRNPEFTNINNEQAKTRTKKTLLDQNHDIGGSKAKFLSETLGYNKGDGPKLHAAVSEAINGKTPDKVTNTQYGTKATFNTKIKGNNGQYHSANVTVVIQKDNGKITWRLITITPGKKDK